MYDSSEKMTMMGFSMIIKILKLKRAGKSSEEIAKQFHVETWVITMILKLYD